MYSNLKKSILKVFLGLFIFLFIFNKNASCQYELFRTTEGIIQITGILNDSVITAKSNQLFVLVNYKEASFIIKLDPSTLETGIDSLDKKLLALKDQIIRYDGKLSIDDVQTYSYSTRKFKVTGFLNSNFHHEPIVGEGTLDHIMGGNFSSRLDMKFKINLEDINFKIDLPDLLQDIEVEIIETLLEPEK